MRKALSLAALTTLLAAPTLAEEPTSLDLTQICANGCIIIIDFGDDARLSADSRHAGAFRSDAVQNPMTHFDGMVVNDSNRTTYRLISEPGMPMFDSIELVKEYMGAINTRIIRSAGS